MQSPASNAGNASQVFHSNAKLCLGIIQIFAGATLANLAGFDLNFASSIVGGILAFFTLVCTVCLFSVFALLTVLAFKNSAIEHKSNFSGELGWFLEGPSRYSSRIFVKFVCLISFISLSFVFIFASSRHNNHSANL